MLSHTGGVVTPHPDKSSDFNKKRIIFYISFHLFYKVMSSFLPRPAVVTVIVALPTNSDVFTDLFFFFCWCEGCFNNEIHSLHRYKTPEFDFYLFLYWPSIQRIQVHESQESI